LSGDPPNEHGWVNLGLTNFYTMHAIREDGLRENSGLPLARLMTRCR